MLILSLAFRNLWSHKLYTFIVGFLLILAMFIMVLGNSIMDSAKGASEKAWRECFAGDLMIRPHYGDQQISSLGFLMGGTREKLREITNYSELRQKIEMSGIVDGLSPSIGEWIRLDVTEDKYTGGFMQGINPSQFLKTFPKALEVIEGRFLNDGEEGLVLVDSVVKQVREILKIDLKIGDTLTANSIFGGSPRTLKLVGVYKFNTSNRMKQMSGFIDLKSAQKILRFNIKNSTVVPDSDQTRNISQIEAGASIDDLFGDGSLTNSVSSSESSGEVLTEQQKKSIADRQLEPIPDGLSGDYTYALVRLKEGVSVEDGRQKLDAIVKSIDPKLEVVDWNEASAGFASISEIVRIIFIVLVVILSLVTVVVIANALLISVSQRTSEIGTMRAIGGQQSFIRSLFLMETSLMSFGFGFIGVILAVIFVGILGNVGITFQDGFTAGMFGSSQLKPVLSTGSIIGSFVILIGVSILSSLSPIAHALRLKIVDALGR